MDWWVCVGVGREGSLTLLSPSDHEWPFSDIFTGREGGREEAAVESWLECFFYTSLIHAFFILSLFLYLFG